MNRTLLGISIYCVVILSAFSAEPGADNASGAEAVLLQHTEVWSNGRLDLIPEVYAENYVGHFPGGMTTEGREGIRAMIEVHKAAFPDWVEVVEEIIVDGNNVATRYRSTATHLGTFEGNPATGNKVDISEASIYRLEDGLIAEQWAYPDVVSLMQQVASPTDR